MTVACTSYYHAKNPVEVRKRCGVAPWASSDTIGYSADQSNWNECAEREDKRIAQEGKDSGGQAKTATSNPPYASQHKPSVGGVPNSDIDRPNDLASKAVNPVEAISLKVDDTTPKTVEPASPSISEEETQQNCKNKIIEVMQERRNTWAQEVLNECPRTKLPRGTYKSVKGSPVYVELEVTDKGCAAYMMILNRTWTVTKTYEGSQGYYTQDYNRDLYCESTGIVTSDQKTDPMSYSGTCAIPHASLSQGATWEAHGPSVTVTDTGLTIRLQRKSATIEYENGLPHLWPKGRRISNDQARISVAFAKPGAQQPARTGYQLPDPPVLVNLDRVADWCVVLANMP